MPLRASSVRPEVLGRFQQERPVDDRQIAIHGRAHLIGQHAVDDFPGLVNVTNRGVDQGLNSRIGHLDAIVRDAVRRSSNARRGHAAPRSRPSSPVPDRRLCPALPSPRRHCSPPAASGDRLQPQHQFLPSRLSRRQSAENKSPWSNRRRPACCRSAATLSGHWLSMVTMGLAVAGLSFRCCADGPARRIVRGTASRHGSASRQTSLQSTRRLPTDWSCATMGTRGDGQLLLYPSRGDIQPKENTRLIPVCSCRDSRNSNSPSFPARCFWGSSGRQMVDCHQGVR